MISQSLIADFSIINGGEIKRYQLRNQLLTSCKSKDNIVEMRQIRMRQSESNRLPSYLPPQLLPHRKPR